MAHCKSVHGRVVGGSHFVILGETWEGVGQCLLVHARLSRAFHTRQLDHTTISKRRSNMASSSRQNERPSAFLSRMAERFSNPDKRWIFTAEEIERSPSRIHGVDAEKEMGYRQSTANFIQDMGHRLKL